MNGWTEISGDKTKKFNLSALLNQLPRIIASYSAQTWWHLKKLAGWYCWYFRIWQWSCQRRPGLHTTIPTTKGTHFAVWPSLTIILNYPPQKTYSYNQLCCHPAGWKPQGLRHPNVAPSCKALATEVASWLSLGSEDCLIPSPLLNSRVWTIQ